MAPMVLIMSSTSSSLYSWLRLAFSSRDYPVCRITNEFPYLCIEFLFVNLSYKKVFFALKFQSDCSLDSAFTGWSTFYFYYCGDFFLFFLILTYFTDICYEDTFACYDYVFSTVLLLLFSGESMEPSIDLQTDCKSSISYLLL